MPKSTLAIIYTVFDFFSACAPHEKCAQEAQIARGRLKGTF